jgi:hypothetical protein
MVHGKLPACQFVPFPVTVVEPFTPDALVPVSHDDDV